MCSRLKECLLSFLFSLFPQNLISANHSTGTQEQSISRCPLSPVEPFCSTSSVASIIASHLHNFSGVQEPLPSSTSLSQFFVLVAPFPKLTLPHPVFPRDREAPTCYVSLGARGFSHWQISPACERGSFLKGVPSPTLLRRGPVGVCLGIEVVCTVVRFFPPLGGLFKCSGQYPSTLELLLPCG